MSLVKFGGYEVPGVSQYKVELSDMDGENTGRSETGYMNRDRVRAGIYKLYLGWTNLSMEEVDALLASVEGDEVSTEFYFGSVVSAEMYAGNRSIEMKFNAEGQVYWDVSFNMTEM